jgi:hypothetical protein
MPTGTSRLSTTSGAATVRHSIAEELRTSRLARRPTARRSADARVFGTSGSLHHLGAKKTFYSTLASSSTITRLKIGHKYAVMITLGSENLQKLYTRDVTLKRASLASARHELGC